ncbi:hypothetical protein [Singulisphaera acidiphila]|uniref:hypothetical protein n=1 Tax=Singulisphaera acidiphila TaxID=466153 RepID=UPI0012F75CBE|nr:hypothetical protein [Singulisphaera acidiphila]
MTSGVNAVSQSEGSTVVGAVCAGYPPAGGSVCDSYCLFLGTGWSGSRGGETPPAGNTADWGLVNCGCGGATSGLLGTGCGS